MPSRIVIPLGRDIRTKSEEKCSLFKNHLKGSKGSLNKAMLIFGRAEKSWQKGGCSSIYGKERPSYFNKRKSNIPYWLIN